MSNKIPNCIGFTGTRIGLNVQQKDRLYHFLKYKQSEGYLYFRHGSCIGTDKEAHDIAKSLGYIIYKHIPIITKYKSFCNGGYNMIPKPYLERNKDIVNLSDILIACPKSNIEEKHSGTWATIRYAKKINKTIEMIFP